MKTVARAFLRYLPRRPSLTVFQTLGIAFGVASAVGMALSGRAALESFAQAVEFLGGRATHTLRRPAGPLGEGHLLRLMDDPAVARFSPVIDRALTVEGVGRVRVLGVDPLLDREIRPALAPAEGVTERFLTEPDAVLVDADLARRGGVEVGDRFDTDRGPFTVLGTFPNPSGQPLLLMDIAVAQVRFGLGGAVDRVDLVLSDPEGFRGRWGPGFLVDSSGQERLTLTRMLGAFRLNLEALSLLGLFVGVFLVYNTATFAVVSRRRDAGILRCLGARPREVLAAFALELVVLGGVGGLAGSVLGYGFSRYLTNLVGGAISNVYFFLQPRAPSWSWGIAGAGVALGWVASALGAVHPLVSLVRDDPIRAVRGKGFGRPHPHLARRVGAMGLAVGLVGAALLSVASLHVYAGFIGAFVLLVAANLTTGAVVEGVGPLFEGFWTRVAGLVGRVASGNVRRSLGRTAVAVAAFATALSMIVGIGLMVGSFRATLVEWLGGQLTGQLYVAPDNDREVPVAFYEAVRALPGVDGVDPYRNVRIAYRGETTYVSGVSARVLGRFARFRWVDGSDDSWARVEEGDAIVSESFWRKFGVGRGGKITLDGVDGSVTLPVAGVFYDYTTEHGVVMIDRATYLQVYRDPTVDSVGVFLEPGRSDRKAVLDRVRDLAEQWDLPVVSRARLHADILEVFDGTFAVTRSMRIIAVIVAFCGIAGALTTLYLERRREFGIYRALGFSTLQVGVMTVIEGVTMGVLSLGLGTVFGVGVAFVLIWVINLQSFHWTVFFHPSWRPFVVAVITAAAASLGASAYPVWRIARTYPQMQLREE